MNHNSTAWASLAAGAMALVVAAPAFGLSALDPWDNAARAGLPVHIKLWLGLMMLNNLASLAFLKNHVAARWWFAGFVVSHAISAGMAASGVTVLAGQVSLTHIICWAPGAYMLWRDRRNLNCPSAYAIWVALVAVFYTLSMLFDFRDASIYLMSVSR